MSDMPPAPGAEGRQAQVLIVDDEPNIVTALQRELRQEAFRISAFTSPSEALIAAQQAEFALVISDNMMPELTGLEMLDRIRSDRPITRRILLTGRTDLQDAVKAFNMGTIHRFLTKPWNKKELLESIREELSNYESSRHSAGQTVDLASVAGARDEQLETLRQELKQSQTQITLYQEGAKVEYFNAPPRVRRLNVLVVDEHEGVRGLVVRSLRKAGIASVHGAPGANEALEYLQSSDAVDVILSEWKMADFDGLALLHAVRGGTTRSNAAGFIMVTAEEQREAVEQAVREGVNGYVVKPFHIQALLTQLDRMARGEGELQIEKLIDRVRGLSYLIVNADLQQRFALLNMLGDVGARNAELAGSGEAAMRILRTKPFAVLIYDCNIIDPHWTVIWKKLQQLCEPHAPPAFILTSVAPIRAEYEEVNRMGFQNFLPGPVQRRKLLELIARVRGGVQTADEARHE